jgi:hypothetical protein
LVIKFLLGIFFLFSLRNFFPPSPEESNSKFELSQNFLSLTKFIENGITFISPIDLLYENIFND